MFFRVIFAHFNSIFFGRYISIYEHPFEVIQEEEVLDANNSHSGARMTFSKFIVEERDYQNGRSPVWTCEFEIPDEIVDKKSQNAQKLSGISKSLPNYRGAKVKFMFREDYSGWFL